MELVVIDNILLWINDFLLINNFNYTISSSWLPKKSKPTSQTVCLIDARGLKVNISDNENMDDRNNDNSSRHLVLALLFHLKNFVDY